MRLSDFYGKQIMTVDGRILGAVGEVIVDLENAEISHLLLTRFSELQKKGKGDIREAIMKNSVLYKRVKNIGETVIVSNSA